MTADDTAVTLDDLTLFASDALGEPALRVAVGDEADVMAVGLLRDAEATRLCLGPDLGLRGVEPSGNILCASCSLVRTPST